MRKEKKKYILFLNNRYRSRDDDFYLSMLNDSTTVAVDGGIRFFVRNDIKPDVLIGDFDSLPKLDKDYLGGIEIIEYPEKKDKTDSQLAVEMAIERDAGLIDICGAVRSSEIDHILGNIFLLDLINKYNNRNKKKVRGRIIEPSQEIYLVSNGKIKVEGEIGDFLSIVPVSKKIWVDFTGLEYEPPEKWIKFGETLPLRNRLARENVSLIIKGKAVVILLHGDG
jgi:thiamine pyrophosphokinase